MRLDYRLKQFAGFSEAFLRKCFFRLRTAEDRPGVLADVTRILAAHNISIEALIQKEPRSGESSVPVIMLTQLTLEKEMNAAIAEIENPVHQFESVILSVLAYC